MPSPKLILIGLRASGKTTLGKALAAQRELSFLDLDDLTAEILAQPSAGDAIRTLGLAAFRAGELRGLQSPKVYNAGILALGGGTPTAPGCLPLIEALKASGSRVVYLCAQPGVLRSRLSATDISTRPTITGADPVAEVDRLFTERDPVNRAVADVTIEVDALDRDSALCALSALLA